MWRRGWRLWKNRSTAHRSYHTARFLVHTRLMKKKRCLAALVAAGIVPTLMFVVPYGVSSLWMNDGHWWAKTTNLALITFLVAMGHVFILGLPVFLLLNLNKWVNWWSSILSGFVLACTPVAILSWPKHQPELETNTSQWDGDRLVETMTDGVPTLDGWLYFVEHVSGFGLYGAAGGLAFWLVWKRPAGSMRKAEQR